MADIVSTKITLGYGGGAYININGGLPTEDRCWLMINSGNLTKNINVPSFSAYDMDLDWEVEAPANVRNDIALGTGLISFQGSISFAITESALNKLFSHKFLNRNNIFDIKIFDGRSVLDLKCCYWTQFTITGNPRQVLMGNLSFVSTNNQHEDFIVSRPSEGEALKEFDVYGGFDEKLVEYWNTGANGLEDFNLTFTREANPIYLNTPIGVPSYIRVGKLGLTGNFSTWKDWLNAKEIHMSNKCISFGGYFVNDSSSFSFEGIDNTGKYSYSIKLYNLTGSSKFTWKITPNDADITLDGENKTTGE